MANREAQFHFQSRGMEFIRPCLTVLLLFCVLQPLNLRAQSAPSAYELQRTKVNQLLRQRSEKFGQYDQSLSTRTGIFGFQTKRDIRNSNEILRNIALTDNEIFRELKVLLDYKDVESQQYKDVAASTTDRLGSYRTTIKKLQDQNELLAKKAEDAERQLGNRNVMIAVLFFGMLAMAFIFYKRFARNSLRNNL